VFIPISQLPFSSTYKTSVITYEMIAANDKGIKKTVAENWI